MTSACTNSSVMPAAIRSAQARSGRLPPKPPRPPCAHGPAGYGQSARRAQVRCGRRFRATSPSASSRAEMLLLVRANCSASVSNGSSMARIDPGRPVADRGQGQGPLVIGRDAPGELFGVGQQSLHGAESTAVAIVSGQRRRRVPRVSGSGNGALVLSDGRRPDRERLPDLGLTVGSPIDKGVSCDCWRAHRPEGRAAARPGHAGLQRDCQLLTPNGRCCQDRAGGKP